jgi:NitT/TauT family transport system substrate-binding protein
MGRVNRRQFLSRSAQVGLGLSALPASVFVARSSAAADEAELNVQIDFLITNSQLGDIVAVERGFYKDKGLNVKLIPGGPNAQTVPSVLSGRALTGVFSGLGQALVAVASGLPVQVFACGYQTSPFAFVSLPRSPIRTPKDMIGKKIAIQPTGRFVMDLLFMKNKIEPASVTVISAGSDITPLMTGQVDCVTMFTTNANALAALGPDYITMTQADAGVPSYANAYFAPKSVLPKNKDLVTRYLSATAKGWAWTHDNPEAAADILAKAYPNLDAKQEKSTVGKVLGAAFDAETAKNGWGTVSADRVAEMIALYKAGGRFTKDVPEVKDVVTFDFLDATAADRPKYG